MGPSVNCISRSARVNTATTHSALSVLSARNSRRSPKDAKYQLERTGGSRGGRNKQIYYVRLTIVAKLVQSFTVILPLRLEPLLDADVSHTQVVDFRKHGRPFAPHLLVIGPQPLEVSLQLGSCECVQLKDVSLVSAKTDRGSKGGLSLSVWTRQTSVCQSSVKLMLNRNDRGSRCFLVTIVFEL